MKEKGVRLSVAAGGQVPSGRVRVPDLYEELDSLVRQIPQGRVSTFGGLARALGEISAARWVAACLLDGPASPDVPRHRVVFRDGRTALDTQARLLVREGVPVAGGVADLAQCEFREFTSRRPLERLKKVQEDLVSRLRLTAPSRTPALVGGVDVSYGSSAPSRSCVAVAAYVAFAVEARTTVWSCTERARATFPYIPGYLAFRELPILMRVLARARRAGRLAPVVLVDGNGTLHRRQAGIATHLGILCGHSTVGIGKSLLCGQVDKAPLAGSGARRVTLAGQTIALAVAGASGNRCVYVSPGHLVDLEFSLRVCQSVWRDHRLPEPIHQAHTLSRAAVGQPDADDDEEP
jgi:deoxyribonuclease V